MSVGEAEEVLAEVRRNAMFSLDTVFGTPSLMELSPVIERYDQAICGIVTDSILAYHEILWPYSILAEGQKTLTFGDTIFEVSAGHDIWDPTVLNLAFIPRAASRLGPKHPGAAFAVLDCGRYSSVRVYQPLLDYAFEFQMPLLQEMVRSILETGQAWMAQKLFRSVSETSLTLTRELYQLLWQLRPRVDRSRVWFLMIAEDRAFYLVEEIISLASIELFSAFTLGSKHPMNLYVEFVTANLPFEVVLSRHANERGQPIRVNLGRSDYRSTNTSLVEAEMSIFGEDLTIMPLHFGNACRLMAIYPGEMGGDLDPLFVTHQRDFENLLVARIGELGGMRQAIDTGARVSLIGKLGEFFGGFVNGISQ